MAEKELSGKVAVVTGAAQGIGRAIVITLARAGATVVVNDLKQDACDAVAKEIVAAGGKALPIAADVTQYKDVRAMMLRVVAELATLDILVNNAGILRATTPLHTIAEEEWDAVQLVNVKGVFNCLKAALPTMMAQRRGRIINIASIAGRSTSLTGGAHYTASKAAVLGLTRHTAREYAPYNITANAIAPGGVDTTMMPSVKTKAELDALMQRVPLKRWATPQEVAELALFLASDRAPYITGASIDINGGNLMI